MKLRIPFFKKKSKKQMALVDPTKHVKHVMGRISELPLNERIKKTEEKIKFYDKIAKKSRSQAQAKNAATVAKKLTFYLEGLQKAKHIESAFELIDPAKHVEQMINRISNLPLNERIKKTEEKIKFYNEIAEKAGSQTQAKNAATVAEKLRSYLRGFQRAKHIEASLELMEKEVKKKQ